MKGRTPPFSSPLLSFSTGKEGAQLDFTQTFYSGPSWPVAIFPGHAEGFDLQKMRGPIYSLQPPLFIVSRVTNSTQCLIAICLDKGNQKGMGQYPFGLLQGKLKGRAGMDLRTEGPVEVARPKPPNHEANSGSMSTSIEGVSGRPWFWPASFMIALGQFEWFVAANWISLTDLLLNGFSQNC